MTCGRQERRGLLLCDSITTRKVKGMYAITTVVLLDTLNKVPTLHYITLYYF